GRALLHSRPSCCGGGNIGDATRIKADVAATMLGKLAIEINAITLHSVFRLMPCYVIDLRPEANKTSGGAGSLCCWLRLGFKHLDAETLLVQMPCCSAPDCARANHNDIGKNRGFF